MENAIHADALRKYAEIVLERSLENREDANSEFAFTVLCFLAEHYAASPVNSTPRKVSRSSSAATSGHRDSKSAQIVGRQRAGISRCFQLEILF